VVVPGTGVVLNNEMDDFAIMPGVPNAFGLVGAEANAVAPGKRPLSSMSPTIVLKDGRPVMTVGAAGGPKIITQSLLAIVNHLDLEMSLRDAVAAPRFHHQWSPDELVVEHTMDESILPRLRRLGHTVREESSMGVTQAIGASADGKLIGVSDPRVPGKAAGQ
jgi:gamma-glutamyltranspeptidase/glutathione hydrolase